MIIKSVQSHSPSQRTQNPTDRLLNECRFQIVGPVLLLKLLRAKLYLGLLIFLKLKGIHKTGIKVSTPEMLISHHLLMKWNGGLNAFYDKFV